MARLNPIYLGIAAGTVAVLALPATRWPLLNLFDAITGKAKSYSFNNTIGINVNGVIQPETWAERTREQQLGKAIALGVKRHSMENPQEKFAELRELVKRQPQDVPAHAALAAHSFLGGSMSYRFYPFKRKRIVNTETLFPWAKLTLEATDGWKQYAPNNAFFPALRAAALATLQRDPESKLAFAEAAACPTYQGFAMSLAKGQVDAFTEAYGYRGTVSNRYIQGQYLLPHLAMYKSMSRWIIQQEGVPGRVQVAKLGENLYLHGETPIEVLVGRMMCGLALNPHAGERMSTAETWTPEHLRAWATALDKQQVAPEFSFRTFEARMEKPVAATLEDDVLDNKTLWERSGLYSIIGACCLLGTVLTGLIFWSIQFISERKASSERFVTAFPHSLWAIAFWVNPAISQFGPIVGGLGAALFLAAIFVPLAKLRYLRYGGFALAGLAAALNCYDSTAVVGIFAVPFLASELMSRTTVRWNWLRLPFAAAGLAVPVWAGWNLFQHVSGHTNVVGMLTCLFGLWLAVLLLVPKNVKWSPKLAPLLSLAWAIGLLTVTAIDLRIDRELAQDHNFTDQEATWLRGQLEK